MKNSTRHKVQEAEYFLCKMGETYDDDNAFSYNLSAFLSAARSVTDYMKKQYKRKKGFAEWYCRKQIQMSADPKLEYLNKARVENVHREPVQTTASREVTLTASVILAAGDDVNAKQNRKSQNKATIPVYSRTVRRFFSEFKDDDVVKFCQRQLDKLKKLVGECEKRFA